MEVTQLDIWLEKIRRGWRIEDVPEYIRPEVKKVIEQKTITCNDWIKANKKG